MSNDLSKVCSDDVITVNEKTVKSIILAELLNTIRCHGPITTHFAMSATKRILGQVKGVIQAYAEREIKDKQIMENIEESMLKRIEELESKVISLREQRDYFMSKCKHYEN
jgi:hypothetical protein